MPQLSPDGSHLAYLVPEGWRVFGFSFLIAMLAKWIQEAK